MRNPWINYLSQNGQDTFHDLDRDNAKAFNLAMKGKKNFILADDLDPFPYLGNPKASVLVLLANPGKSIKKPTSGPSPAQLLLSQNNLIHKPGVFAQRLNSPEMPELESKYFKSRTRRIVEDTSIETVANNLFIVNFHAYHSHSWYAIPFTFYTQRYTFWLVTKAIERGAIILMSRNTIGWLTAIPRLATYSKKFVFESPRSVHISRGNLGSRAYKEIIRNLV